MPKYSQVKHDEPDETLVLLWKMPPCLKRMTDSCPTCGGTGSIWVIVQEPTPKHNEWQTCPYCKEARDLCDAWDELTT